MQNNPKILQTRRVVLPKNNSSVVQPNIEYSRLLKIVEKDNFTKESFYTLTDLSKEQEHELSNINKDSLIPVPGNLIEYENSESGDSVPMSNWVAPHGPHWGP